MDETSKASQGLLSHQFKCLYFTIERQKTQRLRMRPIDAIATEKDEVEEEEKEENEES